MICRACWAPISWDFVRDPSDRQDRITWSMIPRTSGRENLRSLPGGC